MGRQPAVCNRLEPLTDPCGALVLLADEGEANTQRDHGHGWPQEQGTREVLPNRAVTSPMRWVIAPVIVGARVVLEMGFSQLTHPQIERY